MPYPHSFIDYCYSIGTRLTSLRKAVLFILWQLEKPLKAYEILEALLQSKLNSQASTVYRVLDYLVEMGIVHKIESIQSYTLCNAPKKRLPSEVLMLCEQCRSVSEIYDKALTHKIQQWAEGHFFYLGKEVIELKGVCNNCRSKG